MNLYKIFFGFLSFLCVSAVKAQITYSGGQTPQHVVENVLLGAGVTGTNMTFKNTGTPSTASANNLKTFTATGSFPFSSGVFISTEGPSNALSDADLAAITTNSVTSGGVLEFDFVSTGNSLSFNYMFASSEYNGYTCTSFNDVFGFFLSGPGINGPYSNGAINLAIVPGSNNVPVGVNSINGGFPTGSGTASTCLAVNPNYVADAIYFTTQYGTYGNPISSPQFNGGTVVLEAKLPEGVLLQCGETYHIKMGITNTSDNIWQSGVFLQAGSFSVSPMEISFNAVTENNILYEGCNEAATITFSRSGCNNDMLDSLEAWITWGGTATRDTDYMGAVDTIVLAPGDTSKYIVITPKDDDETEGLESIIITIKTLNQDGDTITFIDTLWIEDRPLMSLTAHDTLITCLEHEVVVSATREGGFPGFVYTWTDIDTIPLHDSIIDSTKLKIYPKITENGTYKYILTVTDTCGYKIIDTATVVMNQTLHIDSFQIIRPATCYPTGLVAVREFPYGAHANDSTIQPPTNWTFNLDYKWIAKYDSLIPFPNQNSLDSISGGWYYLELTDKNINCTVYDSVNVPTENVPQAIIAPSATSGCAPLMVTFSNQSVNSNSYVWDFGDGQLIETKTKEVFSRVYPDSTVLYAIQLVASNGDAWCNDTSIVYIQPTWCPFPVAESPNVLNLNPSSPNSYFYIHTENAATIDMLILNRWGQVMYEGKGTQAAPPRWNGTDKSGDQVPDGVYFVKYTVLGVMGDELQGNQFITVVR